MIHVNIRLEHVKLDSGEYDFDLEIQFHGRNGKALQTFRRGIVTVGVRNDFAPAFVHVIEPDTIDNIFKQMCRRHLKKLRPTPQQADHALRYCLAKTRDILSRVQRKKLDELKPENVELAVS